MQRGVRVLDAGSKAELASMTVRTVQFSYRWLLFKAAPCTADIDEQVARSFAGGGSIELVAGKG